MSNISTWLGIFPLVAAMVAVWVGATFFWLRLAGLRTPFAVAAAPAATGAVILVLSYIYYWAGWFWSGARVIPVLAGFGLVGAVAFYVAMRRREARGAFTLRQGGPGVAGMGGDSPWNPTPPSTYFSSTSSQAANFPSGQSGNLPATSVDKLSIPSIPRVLPNLPKARWWILAVAIGWVLAILPTLMAGASNNPVQQWDPSAHLNGVWGMTKRGIAAPGYGLAHNYGENVSTGYPIGWYAFTVLFATQYTVIQAANASTLALMFVWVVGVGAFTAVIFGGRTATLFATVAAGCMLNMPADNLTAYSQWPNAQAVAFLPGTAVVAILVGRGIFAAVKGRGEQSSRRLFSAKELAKILPAAVALLACTIGGIQGHQVMAFNMVVLLLPALLAGAAALARQALRRRNWLFLAGEAVVFVAGWAVLWLVMNSETLQYMSEYPRDGQSWSVALANLITPSPPFQNTWGLFAWITVMTILFLIGIVCVALTQTQFGRSWLGESRRTLLWPLFSVFAFMFLVLIVLGPTTDFRAFITAPWYLDYRRLMGPYNLVIAAFMGYGFSRLRAWITAFWGVRTLRVTDRLRTAIACTLGVVLGVVTFGGALDSRLIAAQSVLDPDNLGKAGMASAEELEMLRSLDDILEDGAVVLGDPQNGSVYAQVIGQRWAYFPQLTFTNRSWTNRQILVYHFNEIHTNPQICEVLVSESIEYYYEDEDGLYYSQLRSDRSPGLYNVDTSTGFELVAEEGTARVWRITACDYLKDSADSN